MSDDKIKTPQPAAVVKPAAANKPEAPPVVVADAPEPQVEAPEPVAEAAPEPILAVLKRDFEYHNGTFRNMLKAGSRISSQHYDFGKMLRTGAQLETTIGDDTIALDASMFQ